MRCNTLLGLTAVIFLQLTGAGFAQTESPSDAPAESTPAAEKGATADSIFETTTPFEPKTPRTQEELDAIEARSLFAAGRTAEQQEHYSEALRLYQRALRYDPNALPILRSIIEVAANLGRHAEAGRYTLRAVELDPSDPRLLIEAGNRLVEQGDIEDAIELYEHARQLQGGAESPFYYIVTMEMGRLLQSLEKYERAADLYAEVLKALAQTGEDRLDDRIRKIILSDPAETLTAIGTAMVRAGRTDSALEAYNMLHEQQPGEVVHALHLAQVEVLRKNYDEAQKHLQKYFDAKASSQGAEPYKLLEETYAGLGQSDQFLDRLKSLLAEDPKNPALSLYLADVHRNAERWDQARPLYKASLEGSPSAEAYRGLAEVERQTQQIDGLLDVLGQATAKGNGLTLLGETAQAIADDEKLVERLIEVAQQRKGTDQGVDYGQSLAVALLALEAKKPAADEFFDHAISLEEQKAAEILMTWGLGLLSHERWADAVKVFQRGVDERVLPSDNPAFYYYLSGALEMDGQTDEALSAARRAASLGRSARLASRIPWILYHAKRYDEAEKAYLDLLEKFDDQQQADTRQVMRETRLILSNICVIKEDLPQAEEWLAQVLDEFPDDVAAMNDLGYLWADQNKNLHRALEMIERAVEEEPDNVAYRDSLGWVNFRLGNYEKAVEELEKAAAGEKPDGLILDHLGDAYEKAGRLDKAREAWQRAVDAYKEAGEDAKQEGVRKKLEAKAEETKAE